MKGGARLATLVALCLALAAGEASADPFKLRVGNSAAQAFSFIPMDVGIRQGIFAKQAVEIARSVTGFSPAVEDREYDLVMPMFSARGHFEPAGLKTIQQSFSDLRLLDHTPDMSTLYTEAYVPNER